VIHFLGPAFFRLRYSYLLVDGLEIGFLLPAWGQQENAYARSLCYEKATQVQYNHTLEVTSAIIGLTVIFLFSGYA
jgi:hypothetical protein